MRGLLKVVPENGVSYVTARLIGNSGGGYVRTAMVNAGADQGAARGQAAIAEGGLIGRLTEIGSRAARVLLITDLNSRIPVVIPASRTSAVLAGDNSDRPRLVFASEPKAIKIGDRVVTSGDGGVFPPGLPVGVVAALDQGGARVEPYAELSQLDYVLLVDYGLAGGLPQPAPAGRGQDRREQGAGRGRKEDALSAWRRTCSKLPVLCRERTGVSRGFLPIATVAFAARHRIAAAPGPRIRRADPGLRADGGLSLVGLPARSAAAERLVRDRLRAGPGDRRHAPGERAGCCFSRAPPCCATAVISSAGLFRSPGPGSRLLAAAVTLGLWALHCVLQLSLLDLRTAMVRGALTVALFPAASLVLGPQPARVDRRVGMMRSR